MTKQFDLIIWDWDGTLADSTSIIIDAITTASAELGLGNIPRTDASNIIGLSLNEAIKRLLGDIGAEKTQALAARYRYYYYLHEENIPLFDGAVKTIIELRKRGFKLAVATGKGRRGLDLAMERSELAHHFHATRTVDECFSKPHPQMLDELMDFCVTTPERTLMIGDTSYDLQMAQNANVQSLAVTYGAQSREQLLRYNALAYFDDFSSLSQWLMANA